MRRQPLALCPAGWQPAALYGLAAHPHRLRRCLHIGKVMFEKPYGMAGHKAGQRLETPCAGVAHNNICGAAHVMLLGRLWVVRPKQEGSPDAAIVEFVGQGQ